MHPFHDQPAPDGARSADVAPARLIRKAAVMRLTGLSAPSIYRLIKAGDFPRQVHLSASMSAWVADEVHQWIDDRIAASRGAK